MPSDSQTTAFRVLTINEYPGGARIIYRAPGQHRFKSFDAVRYPDREAAKRVVEKERANERR